MINEYRCEAGVDVDSSGFAPVIMKCGKPAKLYGMAALCDDCAPKILDRYKKPSPGSTHE